MFIGSGQEIDNSQYFQLKNFIYVISESKLVTELAKTPQHLKNYKQLVLDIGMDKDDNRSKIQQQIKLIKFINDIKGLNTVLLENGGLRTHSIRTVNPDPPKITAPIKLFQNGPFGYYIPGSSIKGSIRQLVLNHLLRNDIHLSSQVVKGIEQNPRDKKLGDQLEKRLFQTFELSDSRQQKIQEQLMDYFRVLKVSDSTLIPDENLEVIEIQSANLEKNKIGPLQMVQLCVKPNVKVSFSLTLDHQLINQFRKTNPDQPLPFSTLDELLNILNVETKELENTLYDINANYSDSSPNEAIAFIDPIDGVIDNLKPNFYTGANTGYDRHTIWPVLEAQNKEFQRVKKKVLPQLPKNRLNGAPASRDKDKFAPRTLRVTNTLGYDPESNLSFGWCHLKMVEDNA
ncbi:MAG: type III-A CRISPR-associated RAMP protein Csm5 [Cyanobacteria bacterium]|nr:type III-A CRISPR-associated RAMP protein Csm5 [Cyanobacteriota bacterium]